MIGTAALVTQWSNVAMKFGFSAAVAGVLLWAVIIGPNSASSMAVAVNNAAATISAATTDGMEKVGDKLVKALQLEMSRMDTQSVARTDAAVRQLQADLGKVREDTQRIRDVVTQMHLEFERGRAATKDR